MTYEYKKYFCTIFYKKGIYTNSKFETLSNRLLHGKKKYNILTSWRKFVTLKVCISLGGEIYNIY